VRLPRAAGWRYPPTGNQQHGRFRRASRSHLKRGKFSRWIKPDGAKAITRHLPSLPDCFHDFSGFDRVKAMEQRL